MNKYLKHSNCSFLENVLRFSPNISALDIKKSLFLKKGKMMENRQTQIKGVLFEKEKKFYPIYFSNFNRK
jgi:hypothetical protein